MPSLQEEQTGYKTRGKQSYLKSYGNKQIKSCSFQINKDLKNYLNQVKLYLYDPKIIGKKITI